jgi:hypothetical protein
MPIIIAGLLLAGFVTNVALGAAAGQPPLGNVAELLLLLGAAAAFTVAILRAEARAKRAGTLRPPEEPGIIDSDA